MDFVILSILIFLSLINLLSFSLMLIDKNSAVAGKRRISEGALFFLAIFFGGLGIYFGMLSFHHKTRKWYFYFGIPLVLAQNFCFLLVLYQVIKVVCFFSQV
jgi:uncharacterized membrane protein YsdA (DUF1294 family)